MIFFTSDTHFCHSNIINLNGRPFSNVDNMNRALIQNWNSYISNHDDVYVLGDFMHKGNPDEANKILKKLKGKKYLIKGNHDKFIDDEQFDKNLFEWIKDYYVLSYKKVKLVLFHYPILEWDGYFGGDIHLYGHVHNSSKDKEQKIRQEILGDKAYNVGVDVNDYFPVSIDKILKKMKYK